MESLPIVVASSAKPAFESQSSLADLQAPQIKRILREWTVDPRLILNADTKMDLIELAEQQGITSAPEEWTLQMIKEDRARKESQQQSFHDGGRSLSRACVPILTASRCRDKPLACSLGGASAVTADARPATDRPASSSSRGASAAISDAPPTTDRPGSSSGTPGDRFVNVRFVNVEEPSLQPPRHGSRLPGANQQPQVQFEPTKIRQNKAVQSAPATFSSNAGIESVDSEAARIASSITMKHGGKTSLQGLPPKASLAGAEESSPSPPPLPPPPPAPARRKMSLKGLPPKASIAAVEESSPPPPPPPLPPPPAPVRRKMSLKGLPPKAVHQLEVELLPPELTRENNGDLPGTAHLPPGTAHLPPGPVHSQPGPAHSQPPSRSSTDRTAWLESDIPGGPRGPPRSPAWFESDIPGGPRSPPADMDADATRAFLRFADAVSDRPKLSHRRSASVSAFSLPTTPSRRTPSRTPATPATTPPKGSRATPPTTPATTPASRPRTPMQLSLDRFVGKGVVAGGFLDLGFGVILTDAPPSPSTLSRATSPIRELMLAPSLCSNLDVIERELQRAIDSGQPPILSMSEQRSSQQRWFAAGCVVVGVQAALMALF
eukprot:jgi/Chrpa1/10996/Chrysochromulina_OHIO_Genome00020563-RA